MSAQTKGILIGVIGTIVVLKFVAPRVPAVGRLTAKLG
jgi:hypothetical protein